MHRLRLLISVLVFCFAASLLYPSLAQAQRKAKPNSQTYTLQESIDNGHRFFGTTSKALARVIQHAFKAHGAPNGYIVGEEGGAAFIGGLRYGEGMLYRKGYRRRKIYWQGPSLGMDFGANGARTFTLIYNLKSVRDLYSPFVSFEGSAYIVGGFGMNFQHHKDIGMAPIRTGVGLRLGLSMGYVKYTAKPSWNPF